MAVPKGMWECPQCGDYVVDTKRKCPRCSAFYKESNEYASSSNSPTTNTLDEKIEQYDLSPSSNSSKSWAAKVLTILSVILFVGGVIVAITSANIEVIGSNSNDTEFRWSVFFTTLLTYIAYGVLTLCAAELFDNIQRIADALQHMKITKK